MCAGAHPLDFREIPVVFLNSEDLMIFKEMQQPAKIRPRSILPEGCPEFAKWWRPPGHLVERGTEGADLGLATSHRYAPGSAQQIFRISVC